MNRTRYVLMAACLILPWTAAAHPRPPVEEDKAPVKEKEAELPAKGYHYVLKNATVVLWQRDSLKMVPDSTTKSLGPSGTPSASRIQMFEAGLTGPFKSVPAVINLRGDGSTAGTKCKDFDDLKTRVKAALSKPEKDGLEEFIFPRVELTAGSLKGEVIYLVQTYFLADPKAQ